MLSYDVEIWNIRIRKERRKAYMLRWRVGAEEFSKSYLTKTQAEGRQTDLRAALRDHQRFDTETGLPESELRALKAPSWYDHARAYALMKWPQVAAKHRASIAESLAVVTPVLVSSTRGAPNRRILRRALQEWAFKMIRTDEGKTEPRLDHEEPPAEIAAALKWLSDKSLKVEEAAQAAHLRPALDAISLKLNGRKAAENTVKRKLAVLSNCWRYAVELDLVPSSPLSKIDWKAPETDDEIDFRYVPGPQQVKHLIEAVREQGPRGEHMYAFFGCFYHAAMRPSEIAALTRRDCRLPESGWGELILAESRPEVGSAWTDDGKSYEARGLKRRARKATRPIPIPPILVKMLREHLKKYGTAQDGRLFRAVRGGRVRSTEYTKMWDAARQKALTAEEADSPLAAVPYSLRHAGISFWLKAGVDKVEVARRAGHSLAVLYRFYAKVLRGMQESANALIDKALAESDE